MKKNLRRIVVSDHALVRYLERVHGLDLNAIRNEIGNQALRRQINIKDSNTGVFNCNYPIKSIIALPAQKEQRCQVVMESGIVVTIITRDR